MITLNSASVRWVKWRVLVGSCISLMSFISSFLNCYSQLSKLMELEKINKNKIYVIAVFKIKKDKTTIGLLTNIEGI